MSEAAKQVDAFHSQLFSELLRKEQLTRDLTDCDKRIVALSNMITGIELGKKATEPPQTE